MRKDISVILPSYNEKENIVEAIERIDSSLGDRLLEMIVVDDNSPDRTWELVENLDHPKVKLIRRETERGLASALSRGIHESGGRVVAWLDCDLGVPPEVISTLVSKLNEADLAIASRFVEGGHDRRVFWVVWCSYLINRFAQVLLGSQIRDYTSGVIAVKREVLQKVPINPTGFGEYFIEFVALAARKRFSIIEVGYEYRNRPAGYSKSTGSLRTFFSLGVQYGFKVLAVRAKINC